MKNETEAYSSPLLCPPYNRPPYAVEDAKLVIVRFNADPAAIAKLVPQPLEPIGDGIVTAFIGDIWQINGPGDYHEGGVSVGVRYKGVTGSYMPFLLTSTDDALLVGREVFGMPKLLCDDGRVWIDGNARRASLVRRGDEILNLSVNLEKRVEGEIRHSLQSGGCSSAPAHQKSRRGLVPDRARTRRSAGTAHRKRSQ